MVRSTPVTPSLSHVDSLDLPHRLPSPTAYRSDTLLVVTPDPFPPLHYPPRPSWLSGSTRLGTLWCTPDAGTGD